jgi:hypothetical protein
LLNKNLTAMKKQLAVLIIPALSLFVACNGAQHKTGDDKPDTGSKHGASGASSASDTINGSAAPFAESTNGTDTSSDGHGVDEPLVDTAKPKKHK